MDFIVACGFFTFLTIYFIVCSLLEIGPFKIMSQNEYKRILQKKSDSKLDEIMDTNERLYLVDNARFISSGFNIINIKDN